MKKIQKYSLVMLAGVGMISTYGATLVNAAAVGQYDSKSSVEFKQGTTVTPQSIQKTQIQVFRSYRLIQLIQQILQDLARAGH